MKKRPSIEHLRIFGSLVYTHIPKQFTKKMDARAKVKIFVGYQDESSNYRVYDPDTKKVNVSRNVTFHEVAGQSKRREEKQQETEVLLPKDVPKDIALEEQEIIQVSEESSNEEEDDVEEVQPANQAVPQKAEAARRVLRNREKIRPPARYEVDCAEYVAPS